MKFRHWLIPAVLLFLSLWLTACSSNSTTLDELKVKNNTYLEGENLKGMKKSQVMEKLNAHAARINIAPMDAALGTGDWKIKRAEKAGQRLNIEKTMEKILNAPDGARISLAVEEAPPHVTAEKLKNNIRIISSFTTQILDTKPSRVSNIAIAAEWINNEVVSPGEVFSFNGTVGKTTKAKGYEKAPIIVKTKEGPKKVPGIGGGVCQLSSTLFNAADRAGMEILERHSHSKPVGYVPKGRDATVSNGSTDFRFRNNRGYPVMIKAYTNGATLTVNLLENRN